MEKNYWENEERKLYHPTFASYMLEIYAANLTTVAFPWKFSLQDGENGQISLLTEIICVLPLFKKYLAIYHIF